MYQSFIFNWAFINWNIAPSELNFLEWLIQVSSITEEKFAMLCVPDSNLMRLMLFF